jgi:hypothetical protein
MLLQNPLLLSQFVYYSYYFLPVLVWSLWVVFRQKVITVINKLWNTTHRLHTRTGKK